MLSLLLALLFTEANAASLDLLEVGGNWGTVAATNPTATWYNPAGLAVGSGPFQFLVEGAPTFANIDATRTNPDYGQLAPPTDDYPAEYDYGGSERFGFDGVVPFVGMSSNFTVPGLGVGAALAVPFARGGTSDQEMGANRFALREGDIRAIYAMLGAGYQIKGKVAIGASVSYVDSTWMADTDTEGYTALAHAVADTLGGTVPPSFQDGYIETPGYEGRIVFDDIKDQALTFGAGIYVTPLEDKLGISVSYNHGVRLDHTGDVQLEFGCPPDYDALGKFAAETGGLCNASMSGTGSVGYSLPSRVHLGVVVTPLERLRVEAMGGYVMWSAFTDYEITTEIGADQVDIDDEEQAAETADLVSQERLWARDNRDTFWLAADGKVYVHKMVMLGGRVSYDHSAIPDAAVSMNNFDANTVGLSAMAMFRPLEQLGLAVSFGHQFLATREITDSAFAVTLDEDAAKEDRYFYPSSNGTYSGSINRLGISIRGGFGGSSRW